MSHEYIRPCTENGGTQRSPQWTPIGKSRPRQQKPTWRRTAQVELKEMGLSWGEASRLAKDRTEWSRSVTALFCT